MTRLTLRKGFTLQPEPGGSGHLTDTQTGDALLIPAEDYAVLAAAATDGLDPSAPGVVGLLVAYGPFFVKAVEEAEAASFYELNIEDAPTVIEIPSVAPVTVTEVPTAEHSLEAARAAAAEDEPATHEHEPFKPPEQDEPLEFTQPAGLLPPEPAPVPVPEQGAPAAPSEEAPQFAAPRTSRRPLLLTLVGVTVLGIMVAVTFALRPGGDTAPGPEVPSIASAALDASTPEQPVDAGEVTAAVTPEPVEVEEAPDAAVALVEPAVDAGAAVQPEPVIEAEDPGEWLTAEVTARDRVKMGEVLSPAEGELSWTVEEEQRVKSRQVLGSVTRESGAAAPLTATAVGLAMLKQPAGATVKRGAVLAEIIYWEAWAKGMVRGAVPKTNWRCEVSSAAAKQRADCKISVVSPRSGGAQITVAIEPRWFDNATDAVLRVAPP